MFQSVIPTRFLGNCVKTAVYTINKLSTRILKGKLPYEVLYGKPPKIYHLRVFGRDVSFREKIFPFKQSGELPKDLFLSSSINYTECTVQPIHHVHEGQLLQKESDVVPSEELAQVEEEDTNTTTSDNSHAITVDSIGHDLDTGVENEASLELESEMENGESSPEVPLHEKLHEQPFTSLESVATRRSTRGFKPLIWQGLCHWLDSFQGEASHDDIWFDAMKQEIHALEENNTWKIVALPSGKKSIGSK
ncbi:uncharacterized protein LOC142166982 [Nicotiana tabacum]|uniref:Uncharacterized protein LOC142166982 n=1 Tax=Nicotiana tabacum TaxID=4097 RepID=A0AC58SE34_TOBAC